MDRNAKLKEEEKAKAEKEASKPPPESPAKAPKAPKEEQKSVMQVEDALESIMEEEGDEDQPAAFLTQSVHKPKFEEEKKLPPVPLKKSSTIIPKPKPKPPADLANMRRASHMDTLAAQIASRWKDINQNAAAGGSSDENNESSSSSDPETD